MCLSGSLSLCGRTEPSAAESQGKGSVSEDELIAAIKEAKGLSYETTESPRPVGQVADKPKTKTRSGLPTIPSPLDQEASSAESGDSEIELVSEDPMASEDALPSGYVSSLSSSASRSSRRMLYWMDGEAGEGGGPDT